MQGGRFVHPARSGSPYRWPRFSEKARLMNEFDSDAYLDAVDRNEEIRAFLKENPMSLIEFTGYCKKAGKTEWLRAVRSAGSLRALKKSFSDGYR